ncbi:MAG: hypothetical protein AAF225_12460, partial [Pseudomonadota bacterium]
YGLKANGVWEEGDRAIKQLKKCIGRIDKMSAEDMEAPTNSGLERIGEATRHLLTAEEKEDASANLSASQVALEELLVIGGWHSVSPALETAFLGPDRQFEQAFAATVGALICSSHERWQPFQKILSALREERILANQEKILATVESQRPELFTELQTKEQLLNAFLGKIGDANVPPDRIGDALDAFYADYQRILVDLSRLRNLPVELQARRNEANRLADKGRIREARALYRSLADDLQARREELAIEESEMRKSDAALALLSDVTEAAQLFDQAAAILPESMAAEAANIREEAADSLKEQAVHFGTPGAFEQSFEFYRALITSAHQRGLKAEAARLQNNLGSALRVKGERGDDQALDGAITAYRDALQERTRERVPLDWAMTQNNLGIALAVKGERGDDQALEDAITAYRGALQERTRDRVPLDWAMTQNNLGIALAVKGERGDDQALEDAIACYLNALEEFTEERAPAWHAMASRNLERALALKRERAAP